MRSIEEILTKADRIGDGSRVGRDAVEIKKTSGETDNGCDQDGNRLNRGQGELAAAVTEP
jgi:hypothetical protein